MRFLWKVTGYTETNKCITLKQKESVACIFAPLDSDNSIKTQCIQQSS